MRHGVVEIAEKVRRGEVAAETLTAEALARIDAREEALHAFLHVARDEALAQARAVDARRARGETLGPLAGVPVAVKDAICTRGMPTTAGSKILAGYVPPYDADGRRAPARGRRGRRRQDEHGRVRDGLVQREQRVRSGEKPVGHDAHARRLLGGQRGRRRRADASRARSAATPGGSIRQPASLTGTVGIKPTYGRVSRYGLIAFASSLDQIGPLATDVRGAARVLSVIAGHDARDSTSLDVPAGELEAACDRSVKGLRIGVPEEYFAEGLDPEVDAERARGDRRPRAARVRGAQREAPAHALRGRDLLRPRHRRGLEQPRALRRRPLRPARRPAATICGPCTAPRATRASAPR